MPRHQVEDLFSTNFDARQYRGRCTPEYDLRLSCFFAITPGMWMNLQLDYKFIRTDREIGEAICKELQPCAA